MTQTSTPTAPAADKKDQAKADARAAFDKALAKAGVPEGQAVRAETPPAVSPHEDKRVPPEEIWRARPKQPVKEDRPRGEDGKFVAKEETEPAAIKDAPKLRAKSEVEDGEENKPEVDETQLERAKLALLRSGFRKKELASMPEAEVLARGLKRAAALEADDEAHRIAKAQRSGRADSAEEPEKRGKAASTEPAMPALDLSSVMKPLSEKLGLNDEGSSALESAFKGIAEAVAKPLLKEIKGLKEQTQGQIESQEASLLNGARKELLGKYPGLAEPEKFGDVFEEMKLGANRPKYRNLPTLEARYAAAMEDACKVLGLEAEPDDAAERQTERLERDERKYARSTMTERSRPPAATPREREWERFNDIMDRHTMNA